MIAVFAPMLALEFQVDGPISERAREAFCDMRMVERPEGAVLYGTVMDESHLLGILAHCRVLGLTVVSARRAALHDAWLGDEHDRGSLARTTPHRPTAPADDTGPPPDDHPRNR